MHLLYAENAGWIQQKCGGRGHTIDILLALTNATMPKLRVALTWNQSFLNKFPLGLNQFELAADHLQYKVLAEAEAERYKLC